MASVSKLASDAQYNCYIFEHVYALQCVGKDSNLPANHQLAMLKQQVAELSKEMQQQEQLIKGYQACRKRCQLTLRPMQCGNDACLTASATYATMLLLQHMQAVLLMCCMHALLPMCCVHALLLEVCI